MNDTPIEKIFSLEEIDYSRFWGTNDRMLEFVRMLFPKLKLIARGEMLKAIGAEEDIAWFEGKLQAMRTYYDKFGRLTENAIMGIMESGGGSPESEVSDEVLVHGRNGLLIKARTPNQQRLVKAVHENDMVFAIGPAGTGKTYTAVAMAVRALKNKEVRRIILTRPAVEAGENLGFLPGDLRDKLDPYLQPLYDALRDMIPQQKLLSYWEDSTIEIAPPGLHARPHAGQCLRHPRRGAERHLGPAEDVPHPHGKERQVRHHRRPHPGRPPAPPAERSAAGHTDTEGGERHRNHRARQQRRYPPPTCNRYYPRL